MFWEFIISCELWPGSIRLVLYRCYPIIFHGSISSLSLDFDSRHCLGSCFIILLFNFSYDSWCVSVFIYIHDLCVAGISLQCILVLYIYSFDIGTIYLMDSFICFGFSPLVLSMLVENVILRKCFFKNR